MTEQERFATRLRSREGRVATLSTGAEVLVRVQFSGPVAVQGSPRLRMGLDDDDGRFVIANTGFTAHSEGDVDGDFVGDSGDSAYAASASSSPSDGSSSSSSRAAFGSQYGTGQPGGLPGVAEQGLGVVERHALFVNGTNTSELLFRYLVRTGDLCLGRLDYHADERRFRSSVHAFEANGNELHLSAAQKAANKAKDDEGTRFYGRSSSGGSENGDEEDNASFNDGGVPTRGLVFSASSHPVLLADLHLNPAGGSLKPAPAGVIATTAATEAAQRTISAGPVGGSGPTTSVAASVGVARFEDLAIEQRGPDYRVSFEAVPYDLPFRLKTETAADVEVRRK